MNVSSFISLRYLVTHRHNLFFSWIAALSVLGVAIGVAAMIVVLSVIDGFEDELRDRFLAANAHIMAFRYPYGLSDHQLWQRKIEKSFVDSVSGTSPFIHAETMARKDGILHAMLIRGVDPAQREKVYESADIFRPKEALTRLSGESRGSTSSSLPAIIIGSGLLRLMEAKIGDTIELLSPQSDEKDPFGGIREFEIAGVYDSGLQHYDNRLGIISIPAAQELFHMGSSVTGLEIGLFEPKDSIQIAEAMREKYQISIKEWTSYNRNIFEAMKMERTVIGIIVFLVAIVAGFNILTTLFVSVSQKQRDISILKSLGAENSQIIAIFLKQASYIGLIGSTLGVLLAFAIGHLLERYQFIQLPDIYLLAALPVDYDWRVYATIALSGVAICILASIYPAVAATWVNPTDGFRGNNDPA